MHVHGRRHLKETVLWATITWSEMGKTYRTYKLKGLFLRAAINYCEVIKFVNDVLSKHVSCVPLPTPQLDCL